MRHPSRPESLIHSYGSLIDKPVLRRPIESAQYTSFAFTRRLIDAGVDASIGSVGDAYDNALAESTIGLFKTEMIEPNRPFKKCSDVELATLTWVDWFNHRRLHGACGDIPPVEFEANHLAELSSQ